MASFDDTLCAPDITANLQLLLQSQQAVADKYVSFDYSFSEKG